MAGTSTSEPMSVLRGAATETPDERRKRQLAVLERVRTTRRKVLERRGGELIPVELVNDLLDEVRGRGRADLD